MRRDSRRVFALVAAVIVLAVGGVVAYVLLPPRQSEDVAVPAQSATPERVVATYLRALNAHDCDTAEAVWIADAQESARSWCDDVASLTNIDIADPRRERPKWSGGVPPEQVVDVSVAFDLSWRLFHGNETMPQGDTAWGYLLRRESPDAPWRIFDEGVG